MSLVEYSNEFQDVLSFHVHNTFHKKQVVQSIVLIMTATP